MKMNYQKSPYIKQIKADARKNGIPIYAVFELTARCNFNCKMCYVHNSNNHGVLERELSTEAWKRIFDQAISAGLLFALLTGGECLLRDDFEELYLYLHNRGVIVSINTNAYLLNEEKVKFFAEHRPERIQISMYGSNEDTYYYVTERRGGYTHFQAALSLLKHYELDVEIAVTPSKLMLQDFKNIIEFLKDNKLSYKVNPALIPPREGQDNSELFLSINEEVELARIQNSFRQESEPKPLEFVPKAGSKSGNAIEGMPCNAGTIRYVITYDGKMIPCTAVPEISADCTKNSLQECWEHIHKQMSKVLQPGECQGCVYKTKCILCPAVRYNGLFSGVANKHVCELMEAKCKQGLIQTIPSP